MRIRPLLFFVLLSACAHQPRKESLEEDFRRAAQARLKPRDHLEVMPVQTSTPDERLIPYRVSRQIVEPDGEVVDETFESTARFAPHNGKWKLLKTEGGKQTLTFHKGLLITPSK